MSKSYPRPGEFADEVLAFEWFDPVLTCSANEDLCIIPLTGPDMTDVGRDGDLEFDLEPAEFGNSLSTRADILTIVTVDTLALAALAMSSGSETSNAIDRGLGSTGEFRLLVFRRELRAEFLLESTGELLLEFLREFRVVPDRDVVLRFAQPALAASVGETTVSNVGLRTATGEDCLVLVRVV